MAPGIIDIAKKIDEGEKRAARLYHAVEDLKPVFEEWKEIQKEQTVLLKDLSSQIRNLITTLEQHGST